MRVQIKSDVGGKLQVRSGNFKGALLSALVIASLVMVALTLTNTSEAKVYLGVDNIFVRGKDTAYGNNLGNMQPFKLYELGDCPPVMMAQRIGSGAVIAMGSASTCRGGVTYTEEGGVTYITQRWVAGELDVLLDKMFNWMVPGAKKVLWYGDAEGNGYEVLYNDANCCSLLIADLEKNFGYIVDNTIDDEYTEITPSLLVPYDILIIPQLMLGNPWSGGDPSLLPDSVVQVIDNFVKGGKGLLIMESSNYLGYNFCNVSNKILRSLKFCSRGGDRYFGFQSDAVYDDDYNHGGSYWPTFDVDNAHPIGSAYQAASGKTTIDIYSPCSLVEENFGVRVSISPTFISGGPGEELDFSVTVKNTGTSTDTFALTASDTKGWNPTLSSPSATLAGGDSRTDIKLRVKIPDTGANGESTTITIKVASPGYENSVTCTAKGIGGISIEVYVGAILMVIVIIALVLIVKRF
jgi:hypothetical protein